MEVAKFFLNLYGENLGPMKRLPPNAFPCLNGTGTAFLNNPIDDKEIKKTVFDINPLKVPRSDGYHTLFYQSQWEHVGPLVCSWCFSLRIKIQKNSLNFDQSVCIMSSINWL
ncbi:hypothetical protein V6Z12_D01G173200 [Gossypium hirsutum]